MPLLEGKTALIFGVANHRSIAWSIAQALAKEGARLALTYQDRMEKYVRDLAATIPGTIVMPCDVQNDEQLDTAFKEVGETFGGLDILIHCVAFAPKAAMDGSFLETSRSDFNTALDISAYSLVAMAQRARPLMQSVAAAPSSPSPTWRASASCQSITSWLWPRQLWNVTCAIWPTSWVSSTFASTPSPPGRSIPSRLAASPVSPPCATIWDWWHPCAATSSRAKLAIPRSSCAARSLAASQVTSSSSMQVTTSWVRNDALTG